jgi:5-methylcytosine-specific restriction protein B
MKILIANIAWIDNGWTDITNQTTSGHKHVQDGGIAHESLNFKFDGKWNDENNIYGFCQFTNPPQIKNNENIIIFYSNKKLVGVYSNVEYGEFKPNNKPKDFKNFNLMAKRVNSFKLKNNIEFNIKKHLPTNKKRIGQNGFTYINPKELLNILDDICTLNADLFKKTQEILKTIPLKDKEMNIWIIAPGELASIWDECKDNEYIAIGWDEINANNYNTLEDLKKDLIDKYDDITTNTKKHNYIWNFGKNIKKGDIVVARNGKTKIIGIGEIVSDYISPQEADNPRKEKKYQQVRYVNWIDLSENNISDKGEFAIQTVAKSNINDSRISIYIKNAIFKKQIEEKAKLLRYQKQIILQGPPGTGKTRLAKQIARYMTKNETNDKIDDLDGQVKLIQFHPSYSYEDFVRGIVTESNGTQIEYKTKDKVLVDMATKALNTRDKPYILIIDEINRANLSSVLGELIYALEYRDEAVESMYDIAGKREITLPSNLYIIGTMNTADRSIGHIDYAIRRRFTFIDVLPDISVVSENSKFKDVEKIFNDHISPEFQKNKVMLGHSYFIADSDDELNNKLKYQVIPLLNEYVSDGVLLDSAKYEIEKLFNNEAKD